MLVGVDLDPRAVALASENLRDLPAVCIEGDVGDPHTIADAVEREAGVGIRDALCIRAFVDHNRSLVGVEGLGKRVPAHVPDVVFSTRSGDLADPRRVVDDWTHHYSRWREVCDRHGLVVIEAHHLGVDATRERLESSHALALQYYHALSGQSLLPHEDFKDAAAIAGFDLSEAMVFPRSVATTSIHRFAVSGATGVR
jgi:hypothetical protein